MEAARDNPELIDHMFSAMLQAFAKRPMEETIMSRNSQERQSRQSSPDKEFAGQKAIEKLDLEQLGQIVYYNSSIDMERREALILKELHEVLFEVGLLDKLPDMVNFMNWERDSSCSVN